MLRAKVYAVLDRRLREGRLFAHSPLQEFDDMLVKSVTTRIQRQEGKRICACWYIAPLVCVRVSVCVCVRMRKRMSAFALPTRVRSHFTMISCSPGTS